MRRNPINFLYNSDHVTLWCVEVFLYNSCHLTLWCVEVGPMANARECSTQEHDHARVIRMPASGAVHLGNAHVTLWHFSSRFTPFQWNVEEPNSYHEKRYTNCTEPHWMARSGKCSVCIALINRNVVKHAEVWNLVETEVEWDWPKVCVTRSGRTWLKRYVFSNRYSLGSPV